MFFFRKTVAPLFGNKNRPNDADLGKRIMWLSIKKKPRAPLHQLEALALNYECIIFQVCSRGE